MNWHSFGSRPRARGVVLGACVLVSVACGDDGTPVGDGSGSGTAGPEGTSGTTQGPGMTGPSVTTGDGTTADATTAEASTAADETTAGLSCDDPPVGEACQRPGPTTIEWQVRIDGRELQEDEITGACTVIDVSDDGTTSTIALDCARFQAEIDVVTSDPHHQPALQPDDPVELHAFAGFEDEANVARYLTLRRGGLALGAFDASRFNPPPSFDFEPVAIEVVATDCPQAPTEFECIFTQDAALQVGFDGQTALVFEGHDASVGALTSYHVLAGLVEHIQCYEDDCGYNYAEWFVQGLVLRVPEG